MHWSEVDSRKALSQDVVHAPFAAMDRLEWYRTRLSSALDKVEQAFPTAALVWRRGACGSSCSSTHCTGSRLRPACLACEPGHEVPCGQFHVPCARNAQFNSVADDVVSKRRERWGVDETGSMIRGHAEVGLESSSFWGVA